MFESMIFEIEVNKEKIKATKGETILETLKKNGIEIPTLCHINELFPTGACRICMVEVEGKANLVPACSHPVEEWMKIYTHSPKVIHARKTIVELLLSNHPDDCLYCERNGNCELQNLAVELLIRQRRHASKKNNLQLDTTSASIVRDQSKCIVCGRCVRVCEEIQGISAIDFIYKGSDTIIGPAYNKGLNYSTCIDCGQCIKTCPTGAFVEKTSFPDLQHALHAPNKKVAVQFSPTIAMTVAEEFNLKIGKDTTGYIIAALRKIGFDYVYSSSFGVDINIMQQAEYLKTIIKNKKKTTVLSSCCPAWVKYTEKNPLPESYELSPVKSPQQIMGKLIKTFIHKEYGEKAKDLYSVSIMPCTAKKYEAQKEEHTISGDKEVDQVLTTREFLRLIKLHGIDMEHLEPETADEPFNLHSSSSRLYSLSGGVTESLIRTLFFLAENKDTSEPRITHLRNIKSFKEFSITIKGEEINFAVVNGMQNAIEFIEKIKGNKKHFHFIEVMACPGGCINGGGQPIGAQEKDMKLRIKGIYNLDEKTTIRFAHKNPKVLELYKKHFGDVTNERSKEFLHKKNNSEKIKNKK